MSNPRRQVEHVTFAHSVLLSLKLCRYREVVARRGIIGDVVRRHVPFADADSLAQKDVVVITMRANTAAGGGKAHHEVINTPVRDERHVCEQLAHGRQVLFDVVHEQRPVPFRHRSQVFRVERPHIGVVAETASSTFRKNEA